MNQPRRTVSPLFAGREEELALLLSRFDEIDRGGPAGTVLVAAEPGGGKSRLVREYLARVRDRALVLVGGCVELDGSGLPYAPAVAALRELLRVVPPAAVRDLVGDPVTDELARLVPALGAPAPDSDLGQARLLNAFLDLLVALTESRPVVLVLEDLHWADSATRTLFAYLVRSLGPVRAQLVATYRHTEIIEGHPLRPMLAELRRLDDVTALHLPRMTAAATAAQLEGILGREPDPALTRAVHSRGDGIPLFTEALVADDGTLRSDVPAALRDLLLDAVHDLPGRTRAVLGAASAGGTRVGHALLARVTDFGDEELTDTLRPAVAARVLLGDGDGYAFRHQLIRTAVEDDLLAGDRMRLHRAYAEAITTDPALVPDSRAEAALARHWHRAGEHEHAVAAAWAAMSSDPPYEEKLRLLDLVVDSWDRAPRATATIGMDRAGVLELAADAACWAGETTRGLVLVEAAVDALGPAPDPERQAGLLLERASLREQALADEQLDALRSAVAIAPQGSLVRAEALGQAARKLIALDYADEARPLAAELRATASADYRLEARVVDAQLALAAGGDPRTDLEAVLAACRDTGESRVELLAQATLLHAHLAHGRHADAIEAAAAGRTRTAQLGLARYAGATILAPLATALLAAGRWDDATEAAQDGLVLEPTRNGRAQLLLCRAEVAVRRADLPRLREMLSAIADPTAEAQLSFPLARLRLEAALLDEQGDPNGAYRTAEAALATPDLGTRDQWWDLLAAVVRRAADDARTIPDPVVTAFAAEPRRTPRDQARALLVEAELARTAGPDVAAWGRVRAAFGDLGEPFPEAYARMRAAAAHAAGHDREAAVDELRAAADLARSLRATPLVDQIDLLGRRLGADLGGPVRPVAPRLTARESEVLRLVAEGLTNSQVAAQLFISAKTASVHVSNILSKLGATTRGEAAAIARRLHLFDPA